MSKKLHGLKVSLLVSYEGSARISRMKYKEEHQHEMDFIFSYHFTYVS